jgi:hypothetical protein
VAVAAAPATAAFLMLAAAALLATTAAALLATTAAAGTALAKPAPAPLAVRRNTSLFRAQKSNEKSRRLGKMSIFLQNRLK